MKIYLIYSLDPFHPEDVYVEAITKDRKIAEKFIKLKTIKLFGKKEWKSEVNNYWEIQEKEIMEEIPAFLLT